MTSCDNFIAKARRDLPDLCSTEDLVRFGIYKSSQAAHHARNQGFAADYFKLPQGTIVYPKEGIINLLENSKHSAKEKVDENHNSRKPYSESTSKSNKKGIRL